jgi:enamine deaminase RidA (YjgF/YER057c/UK114 family)
MTERIVEVVESTGVHAPVGPYSHAMRVPAGAEWLYVSGQISVDQNGEVVGAGDLAAQIEQVFANLESVLRSADFGFDDVVKITTFLVRAEDVPVYRQLRDPYYRKHFPSGAYPASTLVAVQQLANEAFLLEIEAVAARVTPPDRGA